MERKLLAGVAAALIAGSASAQNAAEIGRIAALAGIALPISPASMATQSDVSAQNDRLTQEAEERARKRADAQNDAAIASGQGTATQSISKMMGEMGVQAPVAGQ